jgi:transglutaminase-like putative cysteine protease
MRFEITHTTDYRYEQPASEAYVEARLTPQTRPGLKVLSHELVFDPPTPVSLYEDYFGNLTTFYSMVKRHERLRIVNDSRDRVDCRDTRCRCRKQTERAHQIKGRSPFPGTVLFLVR